MPAFPQLRPFPHVRLGAFVGHGFNSPTSGGTIPRLTLAACLVSAVAVAAISFNIVHAARDLSERSDAVRAAAAEVGARIDRVERQVADVDRKLSGQMARFDSLLTRYETASALRSSVADDGRADEARTDPSELVVHRSAALPRARAADRVSAARTAARKSSTAKIRGVAAPGTRRGS